MKLEENNVITILLVLLCIMASLDIWRQYAVKTDNFWQQHYRQAVRYSYDFWRMGFRLEDLEIKNEKQHKHLEQYLHKVDMSVAPQLTLSGNMLRRNTRYVEYVRDSRIALYNIQHNDTKVYHITCENDGPSLRFGLNDFRADPRDECQIFTNVKNHLKLGPQNFFHVVSLSEGAFALRSMASSNFMKVVPPPDDNRGAPWKLVIGGPVVGSAETFRISDEGYLYSPLVSKFPFRSLTKNCIAANCVFEFWKLGGFFTCAPGQAVLAYPGKYGNFNHFKLIELSEERMIESFLMVDLSQKLSQIQQNYFESRFYFQLDGSIVPRQRAPVLAMDKGTDKGKDGTKKGDEEEIEKVTKICMAIPVTSKGTQMKSVADSPFWNNLFDSFMKSVDWRSNRYVFRFFIGFDRGDALYDTGDAWSDFREEFKHRAIFRMTEQMMDEASINKVLESQLSVKLMHFEHLEGAPSQVVSQLELTAYSEGFDYFYQVNFEIETLYLLYVYNGKEFSFR